MKWSQSRTESKNLETELNAAKKSYKTFTAPKTCPNRSSLGCSLSWDHWYLSFYSSYLDPVSSVSFKGFSKNGFRPSLEIRSRPFFLRASLQAQKKETLGPRAILHSRPKNRHPSPAGSSQRDTAPFSPFFFMISGSGIKESLGPRKENNSFKGPC